MFQCIPQELFIERIAILFVALAAFMVSFGVAWKLEFFSLGKFEKPSRPKLPLRQVISLFGIFFVVQFFIAPTILLVFKLFSKQSDEIIYGWVNVITIFIATVGVVFFGYLLDLRFWKSLWGTSKNYSQRLSDFSIGVISWFISYPAAVVVGQIAGLIFCVTYQEANDQVAIQNIKAVMGMPSLFYLTILSTFTLIPVLEEVLFRGYLQTWFVERFGRRVAIVITSIVFTLFHYSASQGMANFEILPSLFVLSCFLGFIYERQRSIWTPIALHATFNCVSLTMLFIASKFLIIKG